MEDLRSINAHLDNLEAKLRNTFVEIDSRIAKLESAKESGSEERMQELEDLMLLTQIENAKMKESAGSTASFIATDGKGFDERIASIESDMTNLKASNPAFHDSNDIEERISAIEKRIDSLPERGKETFTRELSAIKDSRISKLESAKESGSEERMQELEDLMLLTQIENAKMKESAGSTASFIATDGKETFTRELSAAKSNDSRDVESRLDALEDRLGNVDGKGVVPKELYDKIASLEDKMESLSSPDDSAVLTMKKRLDGIESRFRQPDRISKSDAQEYINKLLSARDEVQADIVRLSSMKSELEAFSSTHGDVEKTLGSVQVSAERANAFYAKAKSIEEALDIKVSEVNSLTKSMDAKVDTMEGKIEARLERLDAVKDSLDLKFREIQSRMSELTELEAKVAHLASMKPTQHDADTDKTVRAVQELQERFEEESAMRASVDKAMQDVKKKLDDIERVRKELASERATAVDMAKGSWNYASNLEKRIEELERELASTNNLRIELDNESASRLAVEKDFEDIRQKVASLDKGVARLFKESPRALQPKNVAVTPAIRAMPDSHVVEVSNAKPMAMISQQTDEELEKHMADFKNQMNIMRSRLLQEGEEFSRFMKEADISQLRHEMQEHQKTLNSVDKKIEKSATKFFAENLEEFAKALDRNMPAFVTRDRYEQDIKRIEGTLKNVTAPDIAPLYDRMDMLERDVGQLVLSLRTMLMRVPIIVE